MKRVWRRTRRQEKVMIVKGVGQRRPGKTGQSPSLATGVGKGTARDGCPPLAEAGKVSAAVSNVAQSVDADGSLKKMVSGGPSRPSTRRAPRTAAVCIKRNDGGPCYAQILRKAREQVVLADIGIEDTRIRWTANGAVLIEISGKDKTGMADSLARKLKDVLVEEAVVTRPIIRGELRIWGLDDFVYAEEVNYVVADLGDCLSGEVEVGSIVKMANGLGSVWVRCSLMAAIRVATQNKMRIGWTIVRVELLQARPMQCYRC